MKKLTHQEIKALELEILDDVVDFCEENAIGYFLTAGTLIGAVRHRGFIPWDDDIDIAMPRESYERFIATYHSKRGFRLLSCRNERGYWYPFACVHAPETYLPYIRRSTLNIGVCIDIFPMDSFLSLSQICMRTRVIGLLKRLGSKGRFTSFPEMFRSSGLKALLLWPLANQHMVNFYMRAIDGLAKGNHSGKSCFWAVPVAPCYKTSERFSHDDVFPLRKQGEFEGRIYNVPNRLDRFLTIIYGDYMKLPPVENRKPSHFSVAYAKDGCGDCFRQPEMTYFPLTILEICKIIVRSLTPHPLRGWMIRNFRFLSDGWHHKHTKKRMYAKGQREK